MNTDSPRRARKRSGRRWQPFAIVALVATVSAIGVLCSTDVAGAAITTFAMSPEAGPPGTVVQVSGNGCTPGLLAASDTDFVTVTATTLDLVFEARVASNGSWQGAFTVPAGGGLAVLPAPVTAVCTSGGLGSLSTIYIPQTFTVTASTNPPPTQLPASIPTTNPPTGSTRPTPTTTPRGRTSVLPPVSPNPTTGPGTSVGIPSAGGSVITGGTTASLPPNRAAGSGSGNDATREVAALATKREALARAATLQPANLGSSLASDSASGSHSLKWLDWLLLIAVALAVLGGSGFLWHSRRGSHDPVPSGGSI